MFYKIFLTSLILLQAFHSIFTACFVCTDEDSKCTTPDGRTGECEHVRDCPILFEAFTNPRKEHVDYLNKFLCEHRRRPRGEGMRACCTDTLNITLQRDEQVLIGLSDKRYCGIQQRDGYFSENKTISIDEFPWLAAVMARNYRGKRDYYWCGGSLINERYVLTSALCAHDDVGDFLFVRLGEYEAKNDTSTTDCVFFAEFGIEDCTSYEDYYIEKMIRHPFYDFWGNLNNIGLLKLNKSVTYTDYIRPICLPTAEFTLAQPNDVLYTTGLGDTQTIKKKVETTLITQEECIRLIGYTIEVPTANMLCTKDSKNTDKTFYGDAGGPTMFSNKGQWHIEGILLDGTLVSGNASRHTRVSRYLHWIRDSMEI